MKSNRIRSTGQSNTKVQMRNNVLEAWWLYQAPFVFVNHFRFSQAFSTGFDCCESKVLEQTLSNILFDAAQQFVLAVSTHYMISNIIFVTTYRAKKIRVMDVD